MKPLSLSPKTLLENVYSDVVFQVAVKSLLDWVPDLKHEGNVCSLAAASLRRQRFDPRREYSENGRRYDLKIGQHAIEAKYHFEGDLYPVLASVQRGSTYNYNPKGWNSAPKAIHDELNRRAPSVFLWLVCVRSLDHDSPYKYQEIIPKFYETERVKTLVQATAAAERVLDRKLLPCFKAKVSLRPYRLPTLSGSHSALVSRLYSIE